MKDIFKQIFKGQPVVSDTKLDTELTEQMTEQMAEEAFEQFLSEGELQQEIEKPVLRSVPLDNEEETEGFFEMRTSDRGVDSRNPDNNTPEAYDAGRVKRESFIEGVKNDINEMDKALSQNELFVRQSREQLKRFKEFARSSEVDLDIVYRLRTSNEALTQDVAHFKKQSDVLQGNLETEKAKFVAANNRYAEIRSALEKARENIVIQIEQDTNNRKEIAQLGAVAVQRETELSRLKRALEKLEIEYDASRDQNQRYAVEMDVKINRSMELEKKLEETSNEFELEQMANEKLVSENKSMYQSMDGLQTENVELRSRLKDAEYEALEVDKRAGEKSRITDDELYSAQARVESLQSQLRVKSQVAENLQEQTKTALAEAEVSKEGSRDLHGRLVEAMRQRDQDREQVTNLNGEIEELNKRFEKILGEMEQSRKENLRLTRTLRLQKQAWGGTADMASQEFEGDKIQTPPAVAKKPRRKAGPSVPPGTKTH
ncbi:MAG: hypothetical protein COB78_03400 [Hyphomicrobiales bacterium]|nr:MAG: hypothetical protein COB78_03400 [Hyphomicrobiales bacterium]